MSTKPYDFVLFGATSFVGQILARYLVDEFGCDGSLRWAAAGRSRPKLESVRADLGAGARKLPLLVADAADVDALRELCRQSRLVVSTVGPYALHGEPLVRACAETGTDYCDLTGEIQWIRRMIATYERQAQESGARIVHCCGFDSIPFDLGVHFLQREAQARFHQPCTMVKMRVKSVRGGLSGGTCASVMNIAKEVAADPALRRELADPYALCPADYAPRVRQHDVKFAEYDTDFAAWTAPFIMDALNTRLVQRTNALQRQAYGREFRYDEAILTGRGLRGQATAVAVSAAVAAFMGAGAIGGPARKLLARFLPAPGEGPTPEAQRKGGYDLRFLGRTGDGRTLRVRVTGDRDPGYGSTAKILGQTAACLTQDVAADVPGGFWTPASLFGDLLLPRLEKRAGLSFTVLE
jgi:short subunit dehydrogenase-like uncharacterized protein